jgi:hypothetical protein
MATAGNLSILINWVVIHLSQRALHLFGAGIKIEWLKKMKTKTQRNYFGARKRTRTSTPLRELGPEPSASANSAIRARGYCIAKASKSNAVNRASAIFLLPVFPARDIGATLAMLLIW